MGLFHKTKRKTFATSLVQAPPTRFPYYEISNLKQGSDEWRLWRKGIIGASDAPTIMSENHWQSAEYLLNEKLGLTREFSGNAATREGHSLEKDARIALSKKFQINLVPTVIQDGKLPYLAASLDAIDKQHMQVFEIKCGLKAYDIVASQGEIPTYYYGQLQHILIITQLDKIMYAAYRPNSRLITIEVGRDETYIVKLRKAESKFAGLLRTRGHKMKDKFIGKQVSRS